MATGKNGFFYSDKYYDDEYEYRHVHLTKEAAKNVPKDRLMTETEWRKLGVQQSLGWAHYMIHAPEPHVTLYSSFLCWSNFLNTFSLVSNHNNRLRGYLCSSAIVLACVLFLPSCKPAPAKCIF
ncbi:unnamed protein product [Toxocara canis]|uniref:Cyclin-dependent kinases regulatory subunit n=1 Tax=Toxocara canis TaxID=6265 RepID=A0A183U4F1_TOXCA|nr:unnamed protein product [Toxocara canis]